MLKLLAGDRAMFTAVGDDDQSIYGWRGATIDNLKRLPVEYPQLKVDRAGAELPLHRAHPARGQRGDRPQPQAVREEAVERLRRRRAGARDRVRRRGARGRARGRLASRASAADGPGRSRSRTSPCSTAPTTRPRVREGAAQGEHPVQGVGRPELLRPRRDQGPVRLAAPARQQRRRPGLPARGDHAQARHRPPDAGQPGRVRRQVEDQPVRGAVRRQPGHGAQRARGRLAARVRPLRERPGVPRPPHHRRRGREGAAAGLAEGHRLREAPLRGRGQREARRGALDQRAGLRRLGRAALRRRDRERRRRCRSRPRRRACSRWRRPSR